MVRGLVLAALIALPVIVSAAPVTPPPAPVEARVPFAPGGFIGSDGQRHLAYELHLSNFYGDTGPLRPQGLQVTAEGATAPLLVLDSRQLATWIRPTPEEGQPASIAAGKRAVLFVWVTLPATAPLPGRLSHRIDFSTDKGDVVRLDGVPIDINPSEPVVLGAPLRGGRWLAHEGPGAAQSHHWGSLVAVNGALTIPQRYALDLVGVDAAGLAIRGGIAGSQKNGHAAWIGYGQEVIAVADGIVRAARDGQPEHAPLSVQPEPAALTADGLFGNYVVLELSPGVFASYAHLQPGSVAVQPGEHVRRGQRLARLGQSGNSAAPHLHFQLSNAATFEGAEGIPYVFEHFELLGPETEAQLFGQGTPWKATGNVSRQRQLPLNDVVIRFTGR